MAAEQLVSVAEAATEVGLSEVTIWRYLQRGALQRFRRSRLGRHGGPDTYVDLGELRRLLADGQEPAREGSK